MIDRTANRGDPPRRLASILDVGRRRYLWTTAAAVLGLLALTATAGLAQAGRLPSTLLSSAATTSDTTAARSSISAVEGSGPPLAVPATVNPAEAAQPGGAASAAALPAGASRLVPGPPERVIDTRDATDTRDGGDGPTAETSAGFAVEGDPVAVVLSVTVMNATRDGSVLVDGRDGVVEAARLPEPGATTTNLVVVPIAGDEVTVRSSAGGHLVVDLVGRFEAVPGPVAAGRFVAVDPAHVAELETTIDGRDLDVSLDAADLSARLVADLAAASAVLAVITADVGTDGGAVRLGPARGEFDQMLMWAPAVGDDRLRRGLVLLEPTDELLTSLRYEGGAELTVEVVGYFTGESARPDDAGLFVPTGPQTIFDGPITAGSPATAPGVRTDSATVLVTVGPRSGIPGQLGSTVVSATGGRVAVTASSDVEVVVVLLGEFRS